MIDNLKPYPSMKTSGVKWLGKVPEHWKMVPLCSIARPKSITEQKDRELLSVYLGRGVIRFSEVKEKRTNTTSEDLSKYQAVDPGDFVLNNQQAWRGSVGVSMHSGIVSPAYIVLSLDTRLNSEFANLLFRDRTMVSHYLIASKGVGSIQRNLYWPHLKRVSILLPPMTEQIAIAHYVNHIDRRVNRLIQAKRKQIELLKEQKRVMIHQVVTRGLDADTPLKESGFTWLGKVPAHWKVKKLRYIGRFQNGLNISGDAFGSGDPFVSYSDVFNNANIPESPSGLVRSSHEDQATYNLKIGDILFTRTSETSDKIGIASACLELIPRSTFAGFLIRFRPQTELLNPRYSTYLFRNQGVQEHFAKSMDLVTRASLSQEALKALPICIPPMKEQNEIADFISKEAEKLQRLITCSEGKIMLLQEYRSRLVSDVVTGKLDVRETAAALPEINPLTDGEITNAIDFELDTDLDEFNEVLEEVEA